MRASTAGRALRNRSSDRRRALQFRGAAARCRRMTFREHMAHFPIEGAYAGCRDWDGGGHVAGVAVAMRRAAGKSR